MVMALGFSFLAFSDLMLSAAHHLSHLPDYLNGTECIHSHNHEKSNQVNHSHAVLDKVDKAIEQIDTRVILPGEDIAPVVQLDNIKLVFQEEQMIRHKFIFEKDLSLYWSSKDQYFLSTITPPPKLI